jgi:hypothetical protein
MMIAEAGAAIGGIKVAMDMAKGIASLKTSTEINQAIIDIQKALLEAQSAAIEDKQQLANLSMQMQELQIELRSKNDWDQEAQRYVLNECETGVFTYELRPEFANGETHHRLCANCFTNKRKSILQGKRMATCQSCEKRIQTLKDPRINYSARNGPY